MKKLFIIAIAMVGLSFISCDDNSNDNNQPIHIDTTIVDTNAVDTTFVDTTGTLIGVWDIVAYPTFPNPTPLTNGAHIIFTPDSIFVYYGYQHDYALNDKGTYRTSGDPIDTLYTNFSKHGSSSIESPHELFYHSDTLEIWGFIPIYPALGAWLPNIMIKRRP
jgi:hypothetical protein